MCTVWWSSREISLYYSVTAHPDHDQKRQKRVGATTEKIFIICAFCWFLLVTHSVNLCIRFGSQNKQRFFFRYSINGLVFRRVRKIAKKQLLASSCLSVCLSPRPHGTTLLPLDEFL